MTMRRKPGTSRRLTGVVLLGLTLALASCASTDTRLAQSVQGEGWGKCDPAPRVPFTLVCYKR